MIEIYKKFFLILSKKEKKKLIFLILFTIIMGLLEVVGIGSIMPFLSVLGNPEIIHTNDILHNMYTILDFKTEEKFLKFLGFSAIFLLLLTALIKTIGTYQLYRFSNLRRHSIAKKLLEKYLHQPYSFFLTRNSSEMTKTILSEVDLVINQIILPILTLTTQLILVLFLISFLIYVDPILAMILASLFGGFYGLMYLSIRKYLVKIGELKTESNRQRFKICSETIGGIKDIKLLGKEEIYLKSFENPSYSFSSYTATHQILARVPLYLVEVLSFGAILFMAMYALDNGESDLGKLLPVLGLYALGALKLKPAINSIYASTSQIKFGMSGLDLLLKDLHEETLLKINNKDDNKRLVLSKELCLKNLSFQYNEKFDLVLDNISLSIKANTTIGVVGTTGSGKSTLIDVILGFLEPVNGSISIDGELLTRKNIKQWQNSIGYVSQNIFLIDDTISANIAFGIPSDDIDIEQVENVSKMAQIHEFISDLPETYNTVIGEKGVRLSGGQRQRLGIARSLYHNPNFLVFDEATSALDYNTESELMKAIDALSGSKTIIMIAHRLSTIEKCDKIIKLEQGKLIEE